ncbi:hypothetical protein ABEG17_06920 [Pedococcus sp. KACC 23699]|uniref:Uncharacterized protein n=1 Tax=Pedococcus sp. KACC 23699 TaxID=3149228 RepID=A0AAU7JXC3_9MICO
MAWLGWLRAKGRARGWRLNVVEFVVLVFLVSRVVLLVQRLDREGASLGAAVVLAVCAFGLGFLLRDVLRDRSGPVRPLD